MGELPVFEPARIGRKDEVISLGPGCSMHVNQQGVGAGCQHARADVEKSDSTRPSEKFPGGRGQEVALQALNLYRHLPHGLAGIYQVRHFSFAADLSHRFYGLDQTRVGWNPGQRDQCGAAAGHELSYRVRVDPALGGIGRTDHLYSPTPCQGEIHDLIGGVVGAAGEDHVARTQVECAHRLGEGDGRVLDHGDAASLGADHRPHGLIARLNRECFGLGSLVATDLLLEIEVGSH
jgi:hypothetical protein